MDYALPPDQFAKAVKELSASAREIEGLKQTIEALAVQYFNLTAARVVNHSDNPASIPLAAPLAIVVEPEERCSDPDLQAFLTVAGTLLHCRIQSERARQDHHTVLSRLDQLKRDMDNVARSEWIAIERLRIAQDLHDRVAQSLFGLGLRTDWVLTHINPEDPLRNDIERIKQMAATGLRQVRESIFALSSGPVEAAQLPIAIRSLLKDLEAAGIVGELHTWGDLTLLPPDVTDALYQIIREAVVNIRRHSHASSALVSIRVQPDDKVTAVIQDDGEGIAPDVLETYRKSGAHLGLRGMESRAERLGGSLTLTPGDDGGLVVSVCIPWKGVARDA